MCCCMVDASTLPLLTGVSLYPVLILSDSVVDDARSAVVAADLFLLLFLSLFCSDAVLRAIMKQNELSRTQASSSNLSSRFS